MVLLLVPYYQSLFTTINCSLDNEERGQMHNVEKMTYYSGVQGYFTFHRTESISTSMQQHEEEEVQCTITTNTKSGGLRCK